MRYVSLGTLAHDYTSSYCFIKHDPDELDKRSYKIARGFELTAHDAPLPLRVHMSEDHPGMELADRVANSCNLLIVSKTLQTALAAVNKGPAQYLPVEIYNHKNRLASADYFVVNPIGTVDALNLKASSIKWFEGDVVSVDKIVLDPAKLKAAPDLFRVKEDPYTYVVSENILTAWRSIVPKPTNVVFRTLEQSEGD